MLNDLLAAVVLEIDVDVGWLVALLGNEALEEQNGATLGFDCGDTEVVADARVGCRSSALTQDVLLRANVTMSSTVRKKAS